ncbi:hypothetical protein PR048_021727 [Dryococelus australis]|uniref:Uncharacterized protein n=1 Tax=Dryococelus australis TaxID=614101 RepID=A0ABQ9GYZ8_9NEOP|nr:hypothetical protein PR048_021727 [Dryococelus australis]
MLAVSADRRKLNPCIIFKKKKNIPIGVKFSPGIHGYMQSKLIVGTSLEQKTCCYFETDGNYAMDSFRGNLVEQVKQLLKDNRTQ